MQSVNYDQNFVRNRIKNVVSERIRFNIQKSIESEKIKSEEDPRKLVYLEDLNIQELKSDENYYQN